MSNPNSAHQARGAAKSRLVDQIHRVVSQINRRFCLSNHTKLMASKLINQD
jgi:hypothetical protein